ncbi:MULTISPECIES: Crp/Fnr family transcriptional regulator [Niastella]|uniref:Crp/Fnr family transcriptional regulator n=1 Tax=Niastella soli TaxID=2821487 RepID=A0ABS3YWT8_9BACT|nr:Crp/Fnr family transcriptional regulator [Niastella soli]MBO9201626.1 Crp/Fnr family transcriptional regulator [Niastella soli]
MSAADKWLLIRNYDLWAHLTDEEVAELNIVHNYIEAHKGDYIYFEAFQHNKLYFVKEGYIRIGFIDESGREMIKEIIQQGELFGQITLEKNSLNGEFAQAYKSEVSLCAFSIDDFQKLLQKKPALALKYSKQVGSKLRQIENRLLNLLNKDVKTRLLNFLWQLVQKQVPPNAPSACIPNYLTHEDIANLIGSSRQTVTTLFNELATEGFITYNRKEICFPDIKRLQPYYTVV